MDIGSLLEGVKEANIFIQLGAVFLISLVPFLEGYIAASVGIVVGFPAVPTIIAASVGNWLSIMAIIVLYEKLRHRRNANQKEGRSGKRMELARKLFNKYGVPGVALIGPLVFGHHIGAFISLVSGASRRYVTLWMTIGVLVWTIAVGVLATVGVDFASRLR
ncbi:small multi-drug export protein [Paenibacillus eucommiae]|uniref:Membrane protein YqaA with SNARE-associated domain n=1 Tax=Paenibacillus eucommiae TaxID=1355755 RepID=A0ABS4ISH7_9BACL|nr:small multi-drug export protein [Paenibacillus eucommiae]MBP1989534.1 membrane protein YqaA with SNARE-associated domain [Paenibacillus eucommiae]